MMMMERLLGTKEESPPVPFFNFTPSGRFLFVFISRLVFFPDSLSLSVTTHAHAAFRCAKLLLASTITSISFFLSFFVRDGFRTFCVDHLKGK